MSGVNITAKTSCMVVLTTEYIVTLVADKVEKQWL